MKEDVIIKKNIEVEVKVEEANETKKVNDIQRYIIKLKNEKKMGDLKKNTN